ncbi:hypothetical protein [Bosea beijingensis]|uniref:hypothetical protein n=1 Tax=Bosea beijingensis TaxID=3068632 RepID=UPI002740CFE2|nr:hypothetical protein [Bosea sp. REN20]
MSIRNIAPSAPTRAECRALAKQYFDTLSFDNVIAFEGTSIVTALAFGKAVQLPTWDAERFAFDEEASQLRAEFEPHHLIGDARGEVEAEIAYCDEIEADCNWQLDCVLFADEFPAAALQMKRFYFERLRKRLERDFSIRIFEACRGRATSHRNDAR